MENLQSVQKKINEYTKKIIQQKEITYARIWNECT